MHQVMRGAALSVDQIVDVLPNFYEKNTNTVIMFAMVSFKRLTHLSEVKNASKLLFW